MDFSQCTAMASGAASGMAFRFLQKMAQAGAAVVLADIDADAVEQAARTLRAEGARAIAVPVDVRKYADIEAAVKRAVAEFGRVDFLLNAAGGNSRRIWRQGPFAEASIESIEWGIDVNLKGAVLFTRAVLGLMCQQKFGVILNLGSIDGVTGAAGIDYTAAKAGMIGLSQGTATYGASHHVRSVCVSPGPVLTRAAMANMKTPLGRAAEVDEVVDLLMYLCSDRAAFITGCNYLIDGGRSCAASLF